MTNDAIKNAIEQNLPEYEEYAINEEDLYDKVHTQFPTLDQTTFDYILNEMVSKGRIRTVPYQIGRVPGYTKPGVSRLPPNQNTHLKNPT